MNIIQCKVRLLKIFQDQQLYFLELSFSKQLAQYSLELLSLKSFYALLVLLVLLGYPMVHLWLYSFEI